MGVFSKINEALGGAPDTSKPAQGGGTGTTAKQTGSWDALRAGRAANIARMAAKGLNPDGSPLQSAMAAHADKVHPVKSK